jgi:hypothetical protein
MQIYIAHSPLHTHGMEDNPASCNTHHYTKGAKKCYVVTHKATHSQINTVLTKGYNENHS